MAATGTLASFLCLPLFRNSDDAYGIGNNGWVDWRLTQNWGAFQMMIARWTCEAKFGRKNEALALHKEWEEQIGSQTDIDVSKTRTLTGSVGAKEAIIQSEMEIANLAELDAFFDKIASIEMHADWGKKFSEVVVSGSTYWEVYRVVE